MISERTLENAGFGGAPPMNCRKGRDTSRDSSFYRCPRNRYDPGFGRPTVARPARLPRDSFASGRR